MAYWQSGAWLPSRVSPNRESVAIVTVDLLARFAPMGEIIGSVTSSDQSPSPAFQIPARPVVGSVGALSAAESILVVGGLLVVGSVVGLVLAVTLKR